MTLLGALLGGVGCGAALAYLGLKYTLFEGAGAERFYTPHTYIGLFVSALFLARVAFRILTAYVSTDAAAERKRATAETSATSSAWPMRCNACMPSVN